MEGGTTESNLDAESSSYPLDPELELGLGLSLGGGGSKGKGNPWGECGRILTAKDFPSSGSKRAAELVSNDSGSPTATASQVVGWPPIRTYRINNLANQAKASRSEQDKPSKDESKDGLSKKICNGKMTSAAGNEKGYLGFVKVNMDGVAIGRKIDLNAQTSYETLAQTLEDMFFRSNSTVNSIGSAGTKERQEQRKPSVLLDGSSDFVLTYEDKEGDWMLVGDVPFGMFLSSVKRLRIMKTCEAKGLAPRFQDQNGRQRSKLT